MGARTPFEKGLERTIEWWKSRRDNGRSECVVMGKQNVNPTGSYDCTGLPAMHRGIYNFDLPWAPRLVGG